MTFMPLNATSHQLPDTLDRLISAAGKLHRFLHSPGRLPCHRVHGAGNLVDVVAEAGHVRLQLVDFSRDGRCDWLEQHPLARIPAERQTCRCRVRADRRQFVVGDADNDLPCSVLLYDGSDSPLACLCSCIGSLLSVWCWFLRRGSDA